jgi:methanethiol S-methyltransferase
MTFLAKNCRKCGFILVLLGFLVQWPTLLTLTMFPILVVMYVKLARNEEQEALAEFGDAYRKYMAQVPGFIPSWSRLFGGWVGGRAHPE